MADMGELRSAAQSERATCTGYMTLKLNSHWAWPIPHLCLHITPWSTPPSTPHLSPGTLHFAPRTLYPQTKVVRPSHPPPVKNPHPPSEKYFPQAQCPSQAALPGHRRQSTARQAAFRDRQALVARLGAGTLGDLRCTTTDMLSPSPHSPSTGGVQKGQGARP